MSPASRLMGSRGVNVGVLMKTRLTSVMSAATLIAWTALAFLVQPVYAASSTSSDLAKIDSFIRAQLDESRIAGLALGIVQGDQIVHLQGFGKADDSGARSHPANTLSYWLELEVLYGSGRNATHGGGEHKARRADPQVSPLVSGGRSIRLCHDHRPSAPQSNKRPIHQHRT